MQAKDNRRYADHARPRRAWDGHARDEYVKGA